MSVKICQGALVAALVITAALGALRSGRAQEVVEDVLIELDEPGSPDIDVRPLDVKKLKAGAAALAVAGVRKKITALGGVPDVMHEIRAAAAAVNDAEDEESKEQAQERLEDLLDRYFDDDMRRRERELKEIEDRVKKLSALLERRRERRREIVDLQVKVLLSEAEGMGLFSNDVLIHPDGDLFKYHVEALSPGVGPPAPAAALFIPPTPAPAPARAPAPVRPRKPRDPEN
jgi:hypothetical protein